MAKEFSRIDESLRDFIGDQAIFFVATAPSEGGRINLSPKGYRDTFAVLDDRTVAYLDLFGSGRVVRPDDAEFTGLLARFGGQHAGIRAVIVVDERPALDAHHNKATGAA
jgi:hypothetical protein